MPYYKGFQEQKEAIKKLQQATNPETPISYREFIKLAGDILNCSFMGSGIIDGKMVYKGMCDEHNGLTTWEGKSVFDATRVDVTTDVVYIEK